MRIEDSAVKLSASHEALRSQTTEFSVKSNFREVFRSQISQSAEDAASERERVANLLQSLVDAILAAIQGKAGTEKLAASECLPEKLTDAPESGRKFEWQCSYSEKIVESEKTSICGQGCVKTQDGRTIDFNFSLDLQRQFNSEKIYSESGSVVLKDPLIINFDGKSSELTDETLSFDLNADGQLEDIPALAAGSGFLVFDRNGNGRADDGSELFGAQSGKGFEELAQFDADHNGWIDEADSVFAQMGVWSGHGFSSLQASGVGALYTGAVDAPFSLKTAENQLLGQIRSAGIYLSEAGTLGHLQQLDLAVSTPPAGVEKPAQGERLASQQSQEAGTKGFS
jgi:hypothetical protein